MRLLPVLASVSLLIAACGGGDSDEDSDSSAPQGNGAEPTTQPAQDERARSYLLTIADFPTGWVENRETDGESPLDGCRRSESEGLLGGAETGTFASGNNTEVQHFVSIGESAEWVTERAETYDKFLECIVAGINDGAIDNDEFEYGEATFGSVSFPSLGDKTWAYRVSLEGTGQNLFGAEVDVAIFIDTVVTQKGNVVSVIQASDILSPFPTHDLETLANKAAAKIP
jgi:hypothetical protein